MPATDEARGIGLDSSSQERRIHPQPITKMVESDHAKQPFNEGTEHPRGEEATEQDNAHGEHIGEFGQHLTSEQFQRP